MAGTVIKDIWLGDANTLATMNKIIVYPVNGWWKYYNNKKVNENIKIRFSLIIGIEIEGDVNLYSEIKSILNLTTLIII